MTQMCDINALDVLGIRQVTYLPEHYRCGYFSITYSAANRVREWISANTRGKYYVGEDIALRNGSLVNVFVIGFDTSREYTYFLMACPHIK